MDCFFLNFEILTEVPIEFSRFPFACLFFLKFFEKIWNLLVRSSEVTVLTFRRQMWFLVFMDHIYLKAILFDVR